MSRAPKSGLEPSKSAAPTAIVAIPAQNEQGHIERCLDALRRQEGLSRDDLGIVLFINNSSDRTREIAEACRSTLPWSLRIFDVFSTEASAGWARRQAMDAAAEWADVSGGKAILLTTDADSIVAPDWVAKNVGYLNAGADIVAGRITLDPGDACRLPASLHRRGRLESAYERLLTEIGTRLDPDPNNPWPCHWTKSGATLAVRLSVYRRVGGMPVMASGEDRAFVDAVRAFDLIARHPMDIEVVTSGRLEGRASGGVADTIKLRCERPESPCDDRLETLRRFAWRTLWCRRLRRLHQKDELSQTRRWAPALSIKPPQAKQIAQTPFFGAAHAAIEAASPKLVYRPVRPAQLYRQMRFAKLFLQFLRWRDRLTRAVVRDHVLPFRPALSELGPAGHATPHGKPDRSLVEPG